MYESLRELRQYSLGKAQGDLFNLYEYQMGRNEEDRARFFSVVASDRTSGHNQKHTMVHLNIRKHFTVRVTEHLGQVPQRGCGVFLLVGIQKSSQCGPAQPALSYPDGVRGVRIHDFQRSPLTNGSVILWLTVGSAFHISINTICALFKKEI